MKKIEVKFPEIDGMRVSGATLDFENGCSVVEYMEEVGFKKGDIIYCEYTRQGGSSWVAINDSIDSTGVGLTLASLMITSNSKDEPKWHLDIDNYQSVELDMIRLATSSEKQLLFDTLEKGGKYWDAEALEVKEFDRVPENIGIYCCNRPTLYDKGDGLYIGFNDNKQNLSTSNGIHTVNLNDDNIYSRTRCYLKPISHEYVKVGDTILCGDKEYLTNYFKVIENGCAYTSDENDVYTLGRFGWEDKLFKLIPIK